MGVPKTFMPQLELRLLRLGVAARLHERVGSVIVFGDRKESSELSLVLSLDCICALRGLDGVVGDVVGRQRKADVELLQP